MHWHLRDKDAKQAEEKKDCQSAVQRRVEFQSAKQKRRTTDTMERIPLQLEQQTDGEGVLESTINLNAAADVQNSACRLQPQHNPGEMPASRMKPS